MLTINSVGIFRCYQRKKYTKEKMMSLGTDTFLFTYSLFGNFLLKLHSTHTASHSYKVFKFISKYIMNYGKIYIGQGSCFKSKAITSFCSAEGIETVFSEVNDQRAIGCVHCLKRSLKNFVLTHLKE